MLAYHRHEYPYKVLAHIIVDSFSVVIMRIQVRSQHEQSWNYDGQVYQERCNGTFALWLNKRRIAYLHAILATEALDRLHSPHYINRDVTLEPFRRTTTP